MNYRADNLRWLGTLIVFSTVILCLTSIPAVLTAPIPQTLGPVIFYAAASIAQSFLFSCICGVVLLPIFFFIRSITVKYIFSILFVGLMVTSCFINAKVFGFWRFYINSTLLHLLTIGGTKVFECHEDLYFWIAADVFFCLIVSVITVIAARKCAPYFKWLFWFVAFFIVYVLAQSAFIVLCAQDNIRTAQYTTKIPYFYDLSWVNGIQKAGLVVFPATSLTAKFQSITPENKVLHYPLHPLQYHLPARPLNVLLIVVDTLRYDMVNTVNMPNVSRYAQNANQFMDNLSGGDCTRPGIFSLFYGIPVTYWRAAEEHRVGSILIRAFEDNHYQLGLFASAPLSSPPFDRTVFADVKHLQLTTPGKTAIDRDIKITEETEHFLMQAGNNHHPFFAFTFYDAPHAYNALTLYSPFHPTHYLNYFQVSNSTSPTPVFNLYKNAVHADDQLIEKVLLSLKENHLDKNTVVIITADHGQEYNEYHNNYWEHASDFTKYQIRTPMLIVWPNRAPHVYHNQTSHFDMVPTLLKRVLGVRNPVGDYSTGDDFFAKRQARWEIVGNYAYYAMVGPQYIVEFHGSGLYRFVDHTMKMLPKTQAVTLPPLTDAIRYYRH